MHQMHSFKRIALGLLAGAAGALLVASVATTKPAQASSYQQAKARINRQINHMSWRQKVGEMFVGDGFPNSPRRSGQIARHYHLGGMIMESDNMQGAHHVKSMTRAMQRATHHSLLIGTDEEGGEVSRLGYNPSKYPSPRAAYRRGGLRGVKKAYGYMDWKLHKLGINWNYAPDADVATSSDAYMNRSKRSFGKNAKKTAKYISVAVPAIQHQRVAATLKHFPGYGNDSLDTDYHTVRSNRSLHHLKTVDFVPFKAGIRKGADSVMVTNIILNKVRRGVPATLSRADINLLRKDLHFNGVIVTDSLDAVAVKNYARRHHANADLLAIKAGNDMVMAQNFRSAIPKITRAIKRGKISKKQVNASVFRILMMKYKLHLNY